MATSFISSAPQSLASWLGPDDTRAANFEFEGIYVHPSHLEGSPDSSASSSVLGYMSEEEDYPAVEQLALSPSSFTSAESLPAQVPFWSRSNGSFSSAGGSDYFSSQHSTSSSPSSSACSTPTCASSTKATSSSRFSSRPTSPPTPIHTAQSPFDPSTAFATYSSRDWPSKENAGSTPATLPHLASFPSPSLSSRGNPYSRRSTPPPSTRSGAMMRSVSTPVETQRQLDQRKSALSAVAAQLDEQAVKLVRSRSSAGLVGMDSREGPRREAPAMEASSSMGLGLAMSRALPNNPHTPFGVGWGSALPLREETMVPLVPFPYNLVHRISPTRLARSQSVTHMEDARYPLAPSIARHDSLPGTSLFVSTTTSVTMNRPRRTTLLSPMTPLFPSPSPTLVERMEDVVDSPPRPARVQRGMSY